MGVDLTMYDRQLMVVAPLPGAPADRAGLRPGAKIIRIDGNPTGVMSLPAAVRALRGPVGFQVTLSVLRDDETDPIQMPLVREMIAMRSVQGQHLGKDVY